MNKELVKLINTLNMIEKDKDNILQCNCDDYEEIEENLFDLYIRSKDLKENIVKTFSEIKHAKHVKKGGVNNGI